MKRVKHDDSDRVIKVQFVDHVYYVPRMSLLQMHYFKNIIDPENGFKAAPDSCRIKRDSETNHITEIYVDIIYVL